MSAVAAALAGALGLGMALTQARPDVPIEMSIRGVWRLVSRTIPATTEPGARVDPFGHVPVGVQRDPQPGLLIFTARHFSRTTDTAVKPRPVTDYAIAGAPTAAELLDRFGPFAANAGSYELADGIVTLRALVAHEPRAQMPGRFARLRVAFDGRLLSLTPVANDAGPIAAGVTSTYERVE
jgi:hypothetical protein